MESKMKKEYFIKFSGGWLSVTRLEFKHYSKRGYNGRVSYSVKQ